MANPTQREFTVARDKVGTVRIVNDATQRTIAALTRREAKQLSRELRRVVKPNGVLLVTRGARRSGAGLHAEITRRARAAAGWTMPPGRLDDLDELDEHVRAAGGEVASLPAIPTDDPATADDALRVIETNLMSWTWDFTDETRAVAAAEVREWVTQTYGDPASVVIASAPVQWRRYRLP
jgi:hypothetical protein